MSATNYEIRSAIRKLIIDSWDKAEVEGLQPGPDGDVAITIDAGDGEGTAYPQVTLRGAASTGGAAGLGPDGLVYDYANRLDVQVFGGSHSSLDRTPDREHYDAGRVSSAIGTHIREIAHEHSLGVPDPDDPAEALTMNLEPLSFPFVQRDPDLTNPPHFFATLELGYNIRRNSV
jgi:hypothetical protein